MTQLRHLSCAIYAYRAHTLLTGWERLGGELISISVSYLRLHITRTRDSLLKNSFLYYFHFDHLLYSLCLLGSFDRSSSIIDSDSHVADEW